jgi:membrane associated rhomboid family serine protease
MPSSFPAAPAREPAFNLPGVILACIVALVLVHAVRSFVLAPEADLRLLIDFAVVPARWSLAWDASRANDILRDAGSLEPLARYLVEEGDPKPWTALTYALLHGSWSHVLLNSVWLAAFGSPVARRCGAARFGTIFAVAAIGGALAHALVHPSSVLPMIGASAGVSGLTAAAATFVFPNDREPGVGFRATREAHERPRQSLGELLRNRSAATFLLAWFGSNFIFGFAAQPLGIVDSAVAWDAHIGGFLAGLLLFPRLDRGPGG